MIKLFIYKIFVKFGYRIVKLTNHQKFQLSIFSQYKKRLSKDKNSQWLIEGSNKIKNLIIRKDAQFDFGEKPTVEIEKVRLNINSGDELFIINEIFCDRVYDYCPNEKFSVVDIGMNVGISSLFFAQNVYCQVIYSFEPIEKTFNCALSNYRINSFADKIRPTNIGLGFPERTEMVDYFEEFKGHIGILGSLSDEYQNTQKEKVALNIVDVSKEFEMILPLCNGKIVVKIDCEGGEYEIIDRISATNLLDKIDVLMIEWHQKGPEPIISTLKNNNFEVYSDQRLSDEKSGMIYGFKSKTLTPSFFVKCY